MYLRTLFGGLFLAWVLVALPASAHAAIPFWGPIIPEEISTCAAGWGAVMIVVNNIISFLITIAIAVVFPLTLAYAGFLYIINPVSSEGRSAANKAVKNSVLGIIIALAAWLIVDLVMVTLYDSSAIEGNWYALVTSKGAPICLPLK